MKFAVFTYKYKNVDYVEIACSTWITDINKVGIYFVNK